ncbi:galactokinase [Candidatus Woesearchaeota archaeon]|nr:galactokinase [Candidatus Woesearchaeota archaeon]
MIISKTPFRISIGGGGTDLPFYYKKHKGSLVTAAIDKYMYISVNKRFHKGTRVSYSKTEIVNNNNEIEHPIVKEALKFLKIHDNLEITSIGDVSSKAGLGSSSSFTVGLLHALHVYKGEYVSKKTLAEEACYLEMDVLKEPVGKQDQYAAAFGGIINLNINQKGNVLVTPLNLSFDTIRELENNILLFYTGITRSASEVLSEQKSEAEKDEQKMQYLTRTKEIGYEIKKALEKDNPRRFGEWLKIHWDTKKTFTNKMTTPEIDEWYNSALKNGAIGGKIIGAGGGGFFMFYVENQHQKKFREFMISKDLIEMPFRFDFDGTKIIFNSR